MLTFLQGKTMQFTGPRNHRRDRKDVFFTSYFSHGALNNNYIVHATYYFFNKIAPYYTFSLLNSVNKTNPAIAVFIYLILTCMKLVTVLPIDR